jgi:hypothetical protein
MIYSYKTPVGTFVIKPQINNPNYFGLWVGDECYGSYANAQTAASDVFSHVTGYYVWDVAIHLETSENLADWNAS